MYRRRGYGLLRFYDIKVDCVGQRQTGCSKKTPELSGTLSGTHHQHMHICMHMCLCVDCRFEDQ